MQKWRRFFFLTVLVHFGLTVFTGLLWNSLFNAVEHHRSPVLLHAMYASFWLFVPFCQPIFWPLSDWVAHHRQLQTLSGSGPSEVIKYLMIALVNSLTAVTTLSGVVWLVQFAQRHPRKSPVV